MERRVVRRLADTFATIDISRKPDVLDLVSEVLAGGRPRVLRRGKEALALVTPYPVPVQKERDVRAALERAAGTWPAEFAEKLQREIRESRDVPPEPAVKL